MFVLWVRISFRKWKRIGAYPSEDIAWDIATAEDRREQCVLRAGEVPNPGYSE